MPPVYQLTSMVSILKFTLLTVLTQNEVTYLNSGGQVGDVLKAVVKCDKCKSLTSDSPLVRN